MCRTGRLGRIGASIAAALMLATSQLFAQEVQAAVVKFNIESQPLAQALNTWADQAGMQIIWPVGNPVAYQRSQAVRGRVEPMEALRTLLEDTGLTYSLISGGQTVAIHGRERAAALARETRPKQTETNSDGRGSGVTSGGLHEAATPSPTRVAPEPSAASREQDAPQEFEEVVVTGTHIRGARPSSPLIALSRGDVDRSGYSAIGDVIRSLPQNYSGGNNPQVTVGGTPGGASGVNISYSGGSAPNLRGLGSGSTLTLVNGRRLAQDMASGAVDVSSIPLAAVERVHVVPDGASATYGSDAVAGVVNFVLRRPFSGAETEVVTGKATEGGAFDRRFSQLLGATWDSGGLIATYEHEKRDALYSHDRTFTANIFRPSMLLPSMSRDSAFIAMNQELSSGISGFVSGLYTRRDAEATSANSTTLYFVSPASVSQYWGEAGVEFSMPGDWTGTVFGSASEQETDLDNIQYAPATPTGAVIAQRALHGTTRSAEVSATGSLISLPTGLLRTAIGVGLRDEEFSEELSISPIPVAVGERDVKYAFAEAAIPLVLPSDRAGLTRLELNASGRYEEYSDAGGEFVPKVGLLYAPTRSLAFRGSWGKSFRAPPLALQYGRRDLNLLRIPDPGVTGGSVILSHAGGNLDLEPENATTWTAGFDFAPDGIPGFNFSATYFDISYADRIGRIASIQTALTDPANAPFVTRNPSPELQQALIASINGTFTNRIGGAYNPLAVAALIDFRSINISHQEIHGVDLLAGYTHDGDSVDVRLHANASYLEIREQVLPTVPDLELTGRAFNPPQLRARGGVTATYGAWSITTTVNYLDEFVNTYLASQPTIESWTTVDAQLAYEPTYGGILSGVRASVSVLNAFDKDPPFVDAGQFRQGVSYDPTNASPLGRFVSVQLRKSW